MKFLFVLTHCVFLVFLYFGNNTQAQAQKKNFPNILLILTDDQGWGDLSVHQNPYLETPVLDKLAKDGIQLTNFYVSPLCAPTRASLLTGRDHLRTGVISVSNGLEVMSSEETTLAEICKENGYQTGCFGKWHNGEHYPNNPNGQGFDEFLGFCAGHLTNYFDSELEHNGQTVKTKGFVTDIITEAAIQFIEKNQKQPFLCYVPYNVPHSPFQVADKYFNKYKAKGLDDELSSVYALCENMDDNVGRLLNKLDELGLKENTIVIFMSDNGPNGHRYNGVLKGIKGQVDEGGVKVPCFIQYPGKIKPGQKIESILAHIDIVPTLVDLCGLKVKAHLLWDGISVSEKLLKGDKKTVSRKIYSHVAFLDKTLKDFPGAVRTEKYRLVVKEKDNPELYDMHIDPSQKNNIANRNSKITRELFQDYQNWFKEVTKNLSFERRIPIASDRTELAAHEALFSGDLKYKEGHGWAHDWLVNWISNKDSIFWKIENKEDGKYEVFLKYTCPENQTGSEIGVSIGSERINQQIIEGFDPGLLPSPDRVKRKEVYEKPWVTLKIGEINIPAGHNKITVSAISIKNEEVAEFKSLILKRIN